MKRLILVVALLLGALLAQAEDVVKLLTIGNSFAVNSTKYLKDIAKGGDCTLVLGTANLGGCSLERHWKHAAAHEADPDSPDGKPYNKRSLKQILQSDSWDVVTIQQYSLISDDLKTYRPFAQNLCDYVRKYAPQAEILIHQTWAYRADDTGKYRDGYDQAAMQQKVHDNYHTLANELGLHLLPVGDAFARARQQPGWHFERDPKFDYRQPQYPNLPNETHSLCRGFYWKKDGKFTIDTHHASPLGEYLGGAVFFEVLFGKSVVGNRFRLPHVPEKDMLFLQQMAHDTVANEKLARRTQDRAKPATTP